MITETINGLHKCKAKNTPQEGEVKNIIVEHKPATVKNGQPKKAWIKITNKKPEEGGSPYRVLNVQKLDWPPDEHQNIAFNIEVEPAVATSEFQQARKTMNQGRNPERETEESTWETEDAAQAAQNPPARPNEDDGVAETRKHLMQSANLLVLCIKATEKAVAPHQPVVAQTSEQFQSDVAKLFIEASGRRTTDGVHWWSYVDKMPTHPIKIKNGDK